MDVAADALVAAGRSGRRIVTVVRRHPRPVAGIVVGVAAVGVAVYLWRRRSDTDRGLTEFRVGEVPRTEPAELIQTER